VAPHISRLFINHNLQINNQVTLPSPAAHHIQHVLRARIGDPLILFDGQGGEYNSKIVSMQRDKVDVNIVNYDPVNRESALNIMLGIGILKREAMKYALQKAAELGVTSITPIETENTSVTRKQFDKRRQNWLQVIQSACEQSGRTMLPALHEVQRFDQWIDLADGDLKLLASPLAKNSLKQIQSTPESISVLIGPEGGISNEEEQKALDAGFEAASIGRRTLRADTVPAAFLSIIQHRWGDF